MLKFFATICGTAGLFFFAQFFAVILMVVVLQFSGNDSTQIESIVGENRIAQLALSIAVASITIAGIWYYLRSQGVKSQAYLLLSRRPSMKQIGEVFLTYGLYFLTLIVVTVVLSIFSNIDINQTQQLGISSPQVLSDKVAVFILLAIIPPIYEEVLFRGFLYNKLRGYGNHVLSVITTSLLFGVAHLEYDNLNWIAAIDTLVFSYFLIYISQKHQSLYSAILLHAIKNTIAFYVLFVA